jgi:hypothetical protein
VKIQYKNETDGIVNIRGKKLRPGESIVSQVFIKHFEKEVENGTLTLYLDGVKIYFEQISAVEEKIVNNDPAGKEISGSAKTDEPASSTETETSEVPAEISAEEAEIDEPEVSSEQQEEETPAKIVEDLAKVQDGTEQESDVDKLDENAEPVTGGVGPEIETVNGVQDPETANNETDAEETVPGAEISAEEAADKVE